MHYTGQFYAPFLPMSDSNSYDNTGATYNVSKILTPEYTLDIKAYEAYSPLFLSTTFSLTYGLSFATITSLIIHTALFNGKEIWYRFRRAREETPDVHTRLMLKYPDSPHWWYGIIFVVMLTFSLVTVLVYPTHLSWWAFFVALLISCVFTIPCGIIQAVTNVQLGLNVITEFIGKRNFYVAVELTNRCLVGYIQPGRPIAMMLFKTYGYITMTQALAFLQGLKMGHYMKVPPRTLFMGQVIASVWTCFVQVAVLNWALGGAISNVCAPENPSHFTCPNGRVFFNASIIWGVIGPQRMFNPGQIYGHMLWFFLAGALFPIAIYLGARMYPKSPIRYLSAPLIFGGTG